MIPRRLVIRVVSVPGRRFRLYLPLWLLWPVLLPFAVVLVPIAGVWCIVRRVNPLRVSCAVWRLVGSISGTHVEIEHPHGSFLMSIV
jgi:hypothetical protein